MRDAHGTFKVLKTVPCQERLDDTLQGVCSALEQELVGGVTLQVRNDASGNQLRAADVTPGPGTAALSKPYLSKGDGRVQNSWSEELGSWCDTVRCLDHSRRFNAIDTVHHNGAVQTCGEEGLAIRGPGQVGNRFASEVLQNNHRS
ncbi:hypothetical protein HYQ46_006665 [Verticillium longisporum]|nr:hypothetical protein HYQ46_006665 [Verticillium longisporum]